MSKNETVRPYDCANCLNSRTPICELCSQITSPSGKVSAPTYYSPDKLGRIESKELAALTSKIVLRLATGNPVNLSWIIRYNDLLTGDK